MGYVNHFEPETHQGPKEGGSSLWPLCLCGFILLATLSRAQGPIEVHVDANVKQGPFQPIYAYFGYDEPNYTYLPNGRKLIRELAALSPVRVQIRAHHLLVTGDGSPAMKWGSTNVYTIGPDRKPVYDWTIVDRIFDTYVQAGARPFVEIGFMPEALSKEPRPYARNWPNQPEGRGWAQPPADYVAWAELIHRWVEHCIERYGKAEVEQWSWELWNEPDIFYWRGTPEEYDKLYDYTADAVKRALPTARVGGPATTDPLSVKAGEYLRQFLEHCANGVNAVTGKKGAPLDFITYHAKGSPKFVDSHVRMGLGRNLQNAQRGLEIVAAFPQFRKLPIVISEYDPEGCAACSVRERPENGYRNSTLYASYTAASLANLIRLGDRYQANVNMLTWAFEFEGKPYFEGYRTLATNFVDKPIMNLFRMAGLMHGDRVEARSSGAVDLDAILNAGVRDAPDIDAIATRAEHEIAVLIWNYHDDDVAVPPSPVTLEIAGVLASRVRMEHFRIDDRHSNAFTAWKEMGSPQQPTPEQQTRLEAAGQLQLLGSPEWKDVRAGKVELTFSLPRQAVSLLRISW
jgi:xylan 1,4-beta-xylosidase